MYYLSKEIGIPQRHSHLNKRHINVTINFQWDRNRLSISYAAPTIYFPSTRFAYKKKSVPESCWLQFADGTEPKDSPLRFSAIMCKCLVPVPTYGFFLWKKSLFQNKAGIYCAGFSSLCPDNGGTLCRSEMNGEYLLRVKKIYAGICGLRPTADMKEGIVDVLLIHFSLLLLRISIKFHIVFCFRKCSTHIIGPKYKSNLFVVNLLLRWSLGRTWMGSYSSPVIKTTKNAF